MEPDLFGALLVLELPFVVAVAALARVGLDAGDGLLVGKLVRRLVLVVVHRPDHERAVGVALQEFDDGFLADAGNELAAPLLAGPDLRDAQLARALVLAIP